MAGSSTSLKYHLSLPISFAIGQSLSILTPGPCEGHAAKAMELENSDTGTFLPSRCSCRVKEWSLKYLKGHESVIATFQVVRGIPKMSYCNNLSQASL